MQIVKPNVNLPFIEKRKPFIVLSIIMVIVGLVLPFAIEPNWGTSFRGGSSIIVHFDGDVSVEEVRSAFSSRAAYSDVSVQRYGGGNASSFMIKTRNTTSLGCDKLASLKEELPPALVKAGVAGAEIDSWPRCEGEGVRGDFAIRFIATKPVQKGATEPGQPKVEGPSDAASGVSRDVLERIVNELGVEALVAYEAASRRFVVKPSGLQAEVTGLLAETFPDRFDPETGLDEIVTVGADVGEKFRNDGIVSILFALGLILLYIAIRFDIRFAPGAVVALAHDVVITFGIITVTGMEVTLETVAALLAIVGYSLNDTIVTFDRIRENVAGGDTGHLHTVVNRAINECLSRTLLTSITTLVAVIALVFISTGVIRDFAITLVIGILVGTYSSIFVASPVMIRMDDWLKKRKERVAVRKKLEGAESSS